MKNLESPRSIEAEMALLGAIIQDGSVMADVASILSGSGDFYMTKHQAIYTTLSNIYNSGVPVDLVQLKQRLDDKNMLDDVGGVDYLVELGESVPAATNASHYAKIVRDTAIRRRLIEATETIRNQAYESADPVPEILDRAEQTIYKLRPHLTGAIKHIDPVAHEVYDTLAERQQEGSAVNGLRTGFRDLDGMLGGIRQGQMLVVAGRASMGKTALALTMAKNLAVENDHRVLIYSLEMSAHQLAERLLAQVSDIDSHRMRCGILSRSDFQTLCHDVSRLGESGIYIDDTPGLSLFDLRARTRRAVQQHSIEAIIIDYLTLLKAPKAENRTQAVGVLSRGLKTLARELDIPVICVSQLNRQVEHRQDNRPKLSDLRDSGDIEQDADIVLLVYRSGYYTSGKEGAIVSNEAEIIVAKNRNGPTGMVKLVWDGMTMQFKNGVVK